MKQRRLPKPRPRGSAAGGLQPTHAAAPGIVARLSAALALHQHGQLDQAAALYREILRVQPQHFDALQLLATIAVQRMDSATAVELFEQALRINPAHAASLNNRGIALNDLKRHEEALESHDRALRIDPDNVESLSNRGNALRDLKRPLEALASYDRALQINPGHAISLGNRGTALNDLRRHEEALASFDRALRIRPDYAEALSSRAAALRELKRPEEALASCDRALGIRPDYAEALTNRGNALRDLKRHEEALENYERALGIRQDYAEALSNRGNVLSDLKRHAEALASYDRALEIKPDDAETLSSRGNALRDLKRNEEALACYERALALKPDYAGALNNRGNVLRDLQRHDEALRCYDEVLALKPDFAEALSNRGNLLSELQRHDEALEHYRRAQEIKPEYAGAHWNEGLCSLVRGDFELGWRKYERRWETEQLSESFRDLGQAPWLGETALAGKTLLLHAEQGFGDTLQFCRYAPLAAARGARVVLEVPPALKTLCQTLAGVDTLLARGEALPRFDFHTPLMSLPLALGTRLESIPASVPYLRAAPARVGDWQAWLGPRDKPRVGLAWSGNPAHKNDRNRSLPLALLLDLMNDSTDFVCLQQELRDDDAQLIRAQSRMRIVSERLKDFADTAALIETLDLVVTVDTSVAHLAGALGKPVWILLPYAADFRWLLEREDSPWYPSARLFRQPQPGQWLPVLAAVRKALAAR